MFEGRETRLIFDCDVMEQSITVTLIAERLKDSTCLPLALLRDTVRQSIHFIPDWESKLQGRYVGTRSDAPANPYEISVELLCNLPISTCYCFNDPADIFSFHNLDGHGCQQTGTGVFWSNNAAYVRYLTSARAADGCAIPTGYGFTRIDPMEIELFSSGDSIRIEFNRHLGPLPDPPYYKIETGIVFRGRRVGG